MLQAKDIMTQTVITVHPDAPIPEVAKIMIEKRISGIPVIDDSGKIIGVVTENDLIDQAKRVHIPTVMAILDSFVFLESPDKLDQELKKMAGTKAGDICSQKPVTVKETTPLDKIATIMAEQKVHTLPVMNEQALVGIIGKADIIRTLIPK